jgi:hypothetical protein
MHGYYDYPVILNLLFLIFLLMAAAMGLLVPFFVFRIRNEIISLNRRMAEAVDLLEKLNAKV